MQIGERVWQFLPVTQVQKDCCPQRGEGKGRHKAAMVKIMHNKGEKKDDVDKETERQPKRKKKETIK